MDSSSSVSADPTPSSPTMDTTSSTSIVDSAASPTITDSIASSSSSLDLAPLVPSSSEQLYVDSILAIDEETGEAMAAEDSSPFTSSESEPDDDDEAGIRPIHLTGDRMLDAATLRELMSGGHKHKEDEEIDEEEEELGSGILKSTNEILLTELPPVPEFAVAPSDSIMFAGSMEALVDGLIVAQAHVNEFTKALDAGSAICRDNRKPIGRIEEVFGPVNQPMYLIRPVESFLSSLSPPFTIQPARIFYVPSQSCFIFPDRTPGTDASNLHDEELPVDQQEFSDDEKEMEMKAKKKKEKKGNKNKTQEETEKNEPVSMLTANASDSQILTTSTDSGNVAMETINQQQ
jgi:H/ACA ribonucleoprotein complex non-core subunit NAF1